LILASMVMFVKFGSISKVIMQRHRGFGSEENEVLKKAFRQRYLKK